MSDLEMKQPVEKSIVELQQENKRLRTELQSCVNGRNDAWFDIEEKEELLKNNKAKVIDALLDKAYQLAFHSEGLDGEVLYTKDIKQIAESLR